MAQFPQRCIPTALSAAFLVVSASACGSSAAPNGESAAQSTRQTGAAGDENALCPGQRPAPSPLPHVTAEHRTLAYWLAQNERYGDLDSALLTQAQIQAQNHALQQPRQNPEAHTESAIVPEGLAVPASAADLLFQITERLDFMRGRSSSGTYVSAEGDRIDDLAAFELPQSIALEPELRVATGFIPFHCGPRAGGLFTESLDLDFDRNLCFTARPQEPLEILSRTVSGVDGLWLARTAYGFGWIESDAPLSPAISDARIARDIITSPRSWSSTEVAAGETRVAPGTLLPAERSQSSEAEETTTTTGTFWIATPSGLEAVRIPQVTAAARPLTRRSFLEEVFGHLDGPYGWGGRAGGRDCSRFLMDTFSHFGLALPRHSSVQAQAGTYVTDVSELPPEDKTLFFESAAQQGLVLLHFPGHIMFYLGQNQDGHPMALHSFSEYMRPCDGTDEETTMRVDRVDVSDLTLGEGSSRTDFLSRVTKVTVFGQQAGLLRGVAVPRVTLPPERPEDGSVCEDSNDAAVFRSPFRPNPTQPLRVMVTLTDDPGPVDLAIFGPDGERLESETHWLGGPPFTAWAEIDSPRPGRYVAVLGDGSHSTACERFTVARSRPAIAPRPLQAPAWQSTWRWERDTENLYAAFVEQLFRDPVGEDRTWSNLQELLSDPRRNLLYDHRHLGEDESLTLVPDCADLPYFLRAYFSWKLKLPFAWRQCRRGRAGRPPACAEEPVSNWQMVEASDHLRAFATIIRVIARNVHSSTDRTLPSDEFTDVYPVALERSALRPGTIFADPFGHVLVIAGWLPQGLGDYGVMIGADAQPDGTVGRRRFWRGSFLFDPDITDAGSGFKTWRPVSYDRQAGELSLMSNSELRATNEFSRWSDAQYEGSVDDFYERVETLINPRPLPADAVLGALVDALHESVQRRVVSVDNGEAWMASHSRTMDMPSDAAIFQTTGPWEDFATPSRDMRLLIAIDAVIGFPEAIRRGPERFGVAPADVEHAIEEAAEQLAELLAARSVQYIRSDGETQTVALTELVARRTFFEMAYNPNDCMEIRWAAQPESEEMASCNRHAPRTQRAKMTQYRPWFSSRQRPAR